VSITAFCQARTFRVGDEPDHYALTLARHTSSVHESRSIGTISRLGQIAPVEHSRWMDKIRNDRDEDRQQGRKGVPTASALLPDGTIVELVSQRDPQKALLALYSAGRWTLRPHVDMSGARLVPFSPKNNLIKNNVVLLPSEPRTYGTEDELVSEIQEFIH